MLIMRLNNETHKWLRDHLKQMKNATLILAQKSPITQKLYSKGIFNNMGV